MFLSGEREYVQVPRMHICSAWALTCACATLQGTPEQDVVKLCDFGTAVQLTDQKPRAMERQLDNA